MEQRGNWHGPSKLTCKVGMEASSVRVGQGHKQHDKNLEFNADYAETVWHGQPSAYYNVDSIVVSKLNQPKPKMQPGK